MPALDSWTVLPVFAAAAVAALLAFRAWVVLFRAALDGPAFAGELRARLAAGEPEGARRLAERLRPAWAAEFALRVLSARDPEQARVQAEEARADIELAAQAGFLAIRALGRLVLPLALAIAIVELGRGFDPGDGVVVARGLAASRAMTRGVFAMSTGMAASLACQIGYGVLARAAKRRLREVQLAADAVASHG